MSAFVVEDKVINATVWALSKFEAHSEVRRVVTQETGFNLDTYDGCDGLARAMFELNCKAVDARYGEGEHVTFYDEAYAGYRAHRVTQVQAYKSLKCWLYQCSEGDVPDTSLLFATMDRISGLLAQEIVEGLPAYEKAEW